MSGLWQRLVGRGSGSERQAAPDERIHEPRPEKAPRARTIGADKEVRIGREELRTALQRAAILSNEKYRGVKLDVAPSRLGIVAHNPEQEEAHEELEADTTVSDLSVGNSRLQQDLTLEIRVPTAKAASGETCSQPYSVWCAVLHRAK